MSKRRYVTVIIHRDGQLGSRSLRLPLWLARVGAVFGGALLLFIVVGAILYAPIVRTAARVPGMSTEIARLTSENRQVHELAATLAYVEGRYSQLRAMLGADVMPETPLGDTLPTAAAIAALLPGTGGCYETGPSTPRHWPLDQPGVITRGPVGLGNFDEVHTGLDIALPTGTPIRAAGGGVVADAGSDTEYGLYVRIRHPEGFVSMYGHASRLIAATGDSVRAGQVVGLSGTTGRSTAPHLHFEVLKDGESVDPRTVVRQRCVNAVLVARGH